MLQGRILYSFHKNGIYFDHGFEYLNTLTIPFKCPTLGAFENLLSVLVLYAISNLPKIMNQFAKPTKLL